MNVKLLAYTQLDSTLRPDDIIRQGAGTLQENVIEYAGRVCYRSDAKMGYNPAFIALRVREGHEDIIEHVRFIFRIDDQPLDDVILLLASQPTVEYTDMGDGSWIFSMNARNVRDFWRGSQSDLGAVMVRLAQPILPSVYDDIVAQSMGEEVQGD